MFSLSLSPTGMNALSACRMVAKPPSPPHPKPLLPSSGAPSRIIHGEKKQRMVPPTPTLPPSPHFFLFLLSVWKKQLEKWGGGLGGRGKKKKKKKN